MKKFIQVCLLFSLIISGANSISATSSQKSRSNAPSSQQSNKSTEGVGVNVVQGQPVELDNGMTIVKYSLDLPTDENRFWGFMYSIEWPVSGPEPILSDCRNFIASAVDDNNVKLSLNDNDVSVSNFIKAKYKYYLDYKSDAFPDNDGEVLDLCEVSIKADSKKTTVTISTDVFETGANGMHGDMISKSFLNNGKTLDYSMMPPVEVMRPLILKYICEFGEPAQDPEDYNFLGYPEDPPVIVNGYMIFDYGLFDGMYIDSSVPVSEIIPLASPDLLEFLE